MLAPGSAAEMTDPSTIQFRYPICSGVLPWRAQSGDAGARPEQDSTTARSPFRRGAIYSSDHPMAARKSERLGRRNSAACQAAWLSRRKECSLRPREASQAQPAVLKVTTPPSSSEPQTGENDPEN